MNKYNGNGFDVDKFVDGQEILDGMPESEAEFEENEVQLSETTVEEVKKKRGRPAGTGKPKAPRDPNAPKKPRGRPAGAVNKQTLETAARLGLTVEELRAASATKKLTIGEYTQFLAETA